MWEAKTNPNQRRPDQVVIRPPILDIPRTPDGAAETHDLIWEEDGEFLIADEGGFYEQKEGAN